MKKVEKLRRKQKVFNKRENDLRQALARKQKNNEYFFMYLGEK